MAVTLHPKDRRGLGEIVALSSVGVAVGAVVIAYLLRGMAPPNELVSVLIGLALLIVARGTQSAAERSGASEMRNYEGLEMREAAAEFRREAIEMRKTQAEFVHLLLSNAIDRALPPAKKE